MPGTKKLMQKTTQLELESLLERAQRGENLEKRRSPMNVLDDYFRKRNALRVKLEQGLAEKNIERKG